MPRASSAIPRMWGAPVSPASVTTTSTRQTRKPATRRQGGASGACTTRRGSSASSAGPGYYGDALRQDCRSKLSFLPSPSFPGISTPFFTIRETFIFRCLFCLGKHLSSFFSDKRKIGLTSPPLYLFIFLVTSSFSGRNSSPKIRLSA